MSFFDAPPPEPPRHPPPPPKQEWMGPPEGWLGGFVPTRVVLAEGATVVVTVGPMEAFPTGVLVDLRVLSRAPVQSPRGPLGMDGGMRLGVAYADGGKWQGARPFQPDHDWSQPPSAPNVSFQGGGGGGNLLNHRLWLWPLPPPGPVTFALAWDEHGIAETTVEVESDLFRRAADEARQLWEPLTPEEHQALMEEHLRRRPPGTGFSTTTFPLRKPD